MALEQMRPAADGPSAPEAAGSDRSVARIGPSKSGIARVRDYGVVVTLVALFIVLCFASDAFLTTTNLLNILDQWSTYGVLACCLTLLLIAGGFDLSAGAAFALCGVISARLAIDLGTVWGWLGGAVAGLAIGVINGLIVNVVRINAFVATLATSIMAGGATLAITGGLVISVPDPSFAAIGNQRFLGLQWTIWIFAVAVFVTGLLLHRTTFGRYVFAVGGNREAARLSGIRVGLVSVSTFALTGLGAGIAGVIAASRVSAGQADAGGFTFLFDVFAVVVIGGTSIAGGVGAIWRTVVGVLLLALIGNGFNLLAVDRVYQSIVFGALILFAVALDVWSRRERA